MRLKEYWADVEAQKAIQTIEAKPPMDWFKEGYLIGFEKAKSEALLSVPLSQHESLTIQKLGMQVMEPPK